MFNGIIRHKGKIIRWKRSGSGRGELVLSIPAAVSKRLRPGGSLAVNGVCLTLVKKKATEACFDVVQETLARTNFSRGTGNERVNLELPIRAGDPLDGHLVQGHVDGVGRVRRVLKHSPDEISYWIEAPGRILRRVREKGSVAIDGVSLTVGKKSTKGFWVHCIPQTLKATILGDYKPGIKVNIETDHLQK